MRGSDPTRWAPRLRATAERMQALGASDGSCLVARGATDAQVAELEERLGIPLPGDLAEVLRVHAALKGAWCLPEPSPLPRALEACAMSTVNLSLDGVIAAEASRQGWVREVFSDEEETASLIWQICLGLVTVPNGDCLGVLRGGPGEGTVLYLSHEGGPLHGWKLAPSVHDFVEAWSRLGFVGPESWALQPFLDPEGWLDGHGPEAAAFQDALGLALD